MIPKGQYFTNDELLALAFSSPIKKTKTMYTKSINGYSEIPQGYYPAPRKIEIEIERQASDATNVTILGSHRTEKSAVISEKKTYSRIGQMGNPNRQFLVNKVVVGENVVSFEELMEELLIRPTEIVSITILHEEGFSEELKLFVKNDSVFNESPLETIEATVIESEDDIPIKSYFFDFSGLTYRVLTTGTTSLVLEGIGKAKSLKVSFKFGVSYVII